MLAPQKNRAGQRVYRRKDVEMVVRIRDLLYEEKFTIAGAKKKLLDEIRSSSSRSKAAAAREPEVVEEELEESPAAEQSAQPPQAAPAQSILPGLNPSPTTSSDTQKLTPLMRTSLRTIKRDLEDLLTLLKSDASISD
jgi:DNA-binding transcriptional MerR regulator